MARKITDKALLNWLQRNADYWHNEHPDYFVLHESDGLGEPKRFRAIRNLARAGIAWDQRIRAERRKRMEGK